MTLLIIISSISIRTLNISTDASLYTANKKKNIYFSLNSTFWLGRFWLGRFWLVLRWRSKIPQHLCVISIKRELILFATNDMRYTCKICKISRHYVTIASIWSEAELPKKRAQLTRLEGRAEGDQRLRELWGADNGLDLFGGPLRALGKVWEQGCTDRGVVQ